MSRNVTKEQSQMFVSWIRFFSKMVAPTLGSSDATRKKRCWKIHYLNTPRKHIEFGILISAPKKAYQQHLKSAQPAQPMRKEATEKDGAMMIWFHLHHLSCIGVFVGAVGSNHKYNKSQKKHCTDLTDQKKSFRFPVLNRLFVWRVKQLSDHTRTHQNRIWHGFIYIVTEKYLE